MVRKCGYASFVSRRSSACSPRSWAAASPGPTRETAARSPFGAAVGAGRSRRRARCPIPCATRYPIAGLVFIIDAILSTESAGPQRLVGLPIRPRHGLGDDHRPGIEDEVSHLGGVDGGESDDDPVVTEVALFREYELPRVRLDQPLPPLFREPESHECLVVRERDVDDSADPELHATSNECLGRAWQRERKGPNVIQGHHRSALLTTCASGDTGASKRRRRAATWRAPSVMAAAASGTSRKPAEKTATAAVSATETTAARRVRPVRMRVAEPSASR